MDLLQGSLVGMQLAPARYKVLACAAPVQKVEIKTRFTQPLGRDVTALQNQLGFRSKDHGSYRQSPSGCRNTPVAGAPSSTQMLHELSITKGTRRCQQSLIHIR